MLRGLPTVNTAGVLGAHLHPSTVHLHDFADVSAFGVGGGGGGAADMTGGDTAASGWGIDSPGSHPHRSMGGDMGKHHHEQPFRQVIFAAAGHKIAVAPLPLFGEAQAASRYFSDRHGHKVHRHQLTVKSSVVLPFWRVLLVGGSDDKIRICL